MSSQVEKRSRRRGTGNQVERRRTGGLRPLHTLTVVAVAVVGVLVAFWALSFIAGLVWGLVKVVAVLALVAGVVWLFIGRRRR